MYLGIKRIRSLLISIPLAVVFSTGVVKADTVVTSIVSGTTVIELAESIVGDGISISSVTYTGAPEAAGVFTESDDSVFGFNSGLILSSGSVDSIVGSNTASGTTDGFSTAGDADLEALSGGITNDAAVLEFIFVPDSSPVFISYVFGSEEYNEFVGTTFNDVFGFFINGVNCAIVDDGANQVPVSINTINNSSQSTFYRDNTDQSIETQMDGLTTTLVCEAEVNPGIDNTLKLAIADTGDTTRNSWVLVSASSVTTTSPEICDDGIDNDQDGFVDVDDSDCEQEPLDDGNDTDSDMDGVVDALDLCPMTVIPESVPTKKLGRNRWALINDDGEFDTVQPKGNGPKRSYSIDDTAGCSCSQIISGLDLGKGHSKFGCSISAMDTWKALVGN